MSDHRSDIQIGLFAVIAVLLLAMMILVFGGFKDFLANTYTVTAYFADASGATDGTPVRLLGIDIGRVRRIALAKEHGGVVMKLDIRNDVDIPSDAPLAIKQEGFIANTYLEFSMGKPTTNTYMPKNGSAVVEGKISTFASYMETATAAVAEVSGKLSSSVGGISEGLLKLTNNLNDITGDEEFRKNLKGMAANTNAVTAELKEKLPGLLDNFNGAVKQAQASMGQTQALLDTYRKLGDETRAQVAKQGDNLDKLQASLRQTSENVSALASSLNDIAVAVKSGQGSLGKLISQDDLYRSVVRAVDTLTTAAEELRDLESTLKEHPDWIIKGPPKDRR